MIEEDTWLVFTNNAQEILELIVRTKNYNTKNVTHNWNLFVFVFENYCGIKIKELQSALPIVDKQIIQWF